MILYLLVAYAFILSAIFAIEKWDAKSSNREAVKVAGIYGTIGFLLGLMFVLAAS